MAHLAFPVLLPGQVQAVWVPTLADDGDDDSELTRQERELDAQLQAVRMQEAPVPIGNLVTRDVDAEEYQGGDAQPSVGGESEEVSHGEEDEEEDDEEGEEEEEDDESNEDDSGDDDDDEDEDDDEEEEDEESDEDDANEMDGFRSPEPSSLGRDVEWT
jgi:hypothetical protein